jgi:hypothetical protein
MKACVGVKTKECKRLYSVQPPDNKMSLLLLCAVCVCVCVCVVY